MSTFPTLTIKAGQVVDSLAGDETTLAPSVAAVNTALEARVQTVNGTAPDADGDVTVTGDGATDATAGSNGLVRLAGALGGTAAAPTALGYADAAALTSALSTLLSAKQDTSSLSESIDDRLNALLVAGANITLTYDDAAGTLTIASSGGGGGGGLGDGDYGDVTISGTGTVITIDNAAVTLAKMANMATGSVIGRTTASSGAPEVLTFSALKTAMSFVKGDVGLGNVDNTSDATKNAATATLTNKTLTAPVLGGIVTTDGANITTANAMGALAVDVTKGLNTKSIAADSTLTFSATPTANTWFGLHLTNTDTAAHVITIPSSFSMGRQAAITSFVIPGSGEAWLTWRYTGSAYRLFGETPYLNNFTATAAPGVGDDTADGYGPGSLWLDATNNNTYICESGSSGAAVWHNLSASGGSVDLASITDMTANARTFNAAADYSAMRTALGVAIGSDVQAYSANLAEYAAVNPTTAGLALLDDTDAAAQRTTLSAAARAQTLGLSGFIETPTDKTYVLVQKARFAFTITETTCKTASGTCTVTFSIDGTPLGGTANSVTSTEGSQAHASANAVAVGQTLTMTVSSNSSAADLSVDLGGTRTLA